MDDVINSEKNFFCQDLAVGSYDIVDDVWYFRFRKNNYKVPSAFAWNRMHYTKRHPTLKIEYLDNSWMISRYNHHLFSVQVLLHLP